jgi:hypothetical protein
MKEYGRAEVYVHVFLTSVLDGGEWVSFITQQIYPRGKNTPVPIG